MARAALICLLLGVTIVALSAAPPANLNADTSISKEESESNESNNCEITYDPNQRKDTPPVKLGGRKSNEESHEADEEGSTEHEITERTKRDEESSLPKRPLPSEESEEKSDESSEEADNKQKEADNKQKEEDNKAPLLLLGQKKQENPTTFI